MKVNTQGAMHCNKSTGQRPITLSYSATATGQRRGSGPGHLCRVGKPRNGAASSALARTSLRQSASQPRGLCSGPRPLDAGNPCTIGGHLVCNAPGLFLWHRCAFLLPRPIPSHHPTRPRSLWPLSVPLGGPALRTNPASSPCSYISSHKAGGNVYHPRAGAIL